MEVPKDYSTYSEERAPVPATRNTPKNLDGAFSTRRHRELAGGINPNDLLSKLYNLSKEHNEAVANKTLQQHYSSVFQKRDNRTYKVYINYLDDGKKSETYLVRVGKNTLREVKAKLPIKGEYRLFFIHPGNECEEVEDDDSPLPYHEKDGAFNIYCRVFTK